MLVDGCAEALRDSAGVEDNLFVSVLPAFSLASNQLEEYYTVPQHCINAIRHQEISSAFPNEKPSARDEADTANITRSANKSPDPPDSVAELIRVLLIDAPVLVVLPLPPMQLSHQELPLQPATPFPIVNRSTIALPFLHFKFLPMFA